MFRRIKQAIDNLVAALNRWANAANRHAEQLETEEIPASERVLNEAAAAAKATGKKK
jgi:hypothetical protein